MATFRRRLKKKKKRRPPKPPKAKTKEMGSQASGQVKARKKNTPKRTKTVSFLAIPPFFGKKILANPKKNARDYLKGPKAIGAEIFFS
jgi:hypothetical protein